MYRDMALLSRVNFARSCKTLARFASTTRALVCSLQDFNDYFPVNRDFGKPANRRFDPFKFSNHHLGRMINGDEDVSFTPHHQQWINGQIQAVSKDMGTTPARTIMRKRGNILHIKLIGAGAVRNITLPAVPQLQAKKPLERFPLRTKHWKKAVHKHWLALMEASLSDRSAAQSGRTDTLSIAIRRMREKEGHLLLDSNQSPIKASIEAINRELRDFRL